jgi:hypothetical protein
MESVDEQLARLYEERGVLDYVAAITEGREMAAFDMRRLCQRFTRELNALRSLTAEARILDAELNVRTTVEASRGLRQLEAWRRSETARK